MKYSKFYATPNVLMGMLLRLKVFETRKVIIKVDNFPDYDMSGYRKDEMADYYFSNSWKFDELFDSVLNLDIIDTRIYHADDFRHRSDWDELKYLKYDEERLNEIHLLDEDWFSENGFDTSYDEFELRNFRLKLIDNSKKRLYYEGVFLGDNLSIDMVDHGIYSLIEITGVSTTPKLFYKELIAESFILKKENKNNLAFFMMYSALESYVNRILESEHTKGRFDDKIKELFKIKYDNLNDNAVYSSVINEFDKLTRKRNVIAHGKESIKIGDQDLDSIMLFVVTLIFSYSYNCPTFSEILEKIENGV